MSFKYGLPAICAMLSAPFVQPGVVFKQCADHDPTTALLTWQDAKFDTDSQQASVAIRPAPGLVGKNFETLHVLVEGNGILTRIGQKALDAMNVSMPTPDQDLFALAQQNDMQKKYKLDSFQINDAPFTIAAFQGAWLDQEYKIASPKKNCPYLALAAKIPGWSATVRSFATLQGDKKTDTSNALLASQIDLPPGVPSTALPAMCFEVEGSMFGGHSHFAPSGDDKAPQAVLSGEERGPPACLAKMDTFSVWSKEEESCLKEMDAYVDLVARQIAGMN